MATKKLQIIDSIVKQVDWNQTDETQKDFIKNKPDEEDALELVSEMGIIDPVTDETGAVLTDENGYILTI